MSSSWYEPSAPEPTFTQRSWGEYDPTSQLLARHRPRRRTGHQGSRNRYARQEWYSESLWPPTQSRRNPHRSTSCAVEGSVYTDPGLSSRSTSRRSSTNLPNTPNAPGSTTVHTGRAFLAPKDLVRAEHLQSWNFEVIQDQSLTGPHFSTPTYHEDLESTMSGNPVPYTIEEQLSESSFSTMSQPDSQQATSVPSHWPASEKRFDLRFDAVAGSWQINENVSWSERNNDILPFDEYDAACYNPYLPISWDLDNQEDNSNNVFVESDPITPSVKIEYPTVHCEICGNGYTGRYGQGNMHRHMRLKHASTPQKEYSCAICPRKYKRIDALRNHERSKHTSI